MTIPMADGAPLHADLYGTGARAVVLVHGGQFDKSSWRPQARVLASAGLRVLALDLRAGVEMRAGKQTDCLYDPRCLSTDVLAAVRYLHAQGAEQVSVVGASLGGGAVAQASIDSAAGEIERLVLLAHMAVEAPEKMPGRKLFIVARDDPGSSGALRLVRIREQFDRASEPKRLLIVDGNAHAQALFETSEGPALLKEIEAFLLAP